MQYNLKFKAEQRESETERERHPTGNKKGQDGRIVANKKGSER